MLGKSAGVLTKADIDKLCVLICEMTCRTLADISLYLIPLIWLGIRRKWWAEGGCPLLLRYDVAADNPDEEFPAEHAAEQDDADQAPEGQGQDDEGPEPNVAAPGAASHHGGHGAGDGPTRPMSLNAARAEAKRRRQVCASTLQYSARLFCMPLGVRLCKVLAYVPGPVERVFNEELIPGVKTRGGVQALHHELVDGKLLDLVVAVMDNALTADFASTISLSSSIEHISDGMRSQDRAVARAAWAYAEGFASQLTLTSSFYEAPPLVFIGLTDPRSDFQIHRNRLAYLKQLFEYERSLEESSKENRDCAAFLQNMAWPIQQWPREVLTQLWMVDFEYLNPVLLNDLECYSMSFLSTLPNELLNNHGRAVASQNRKGAFGAEAFWHSSMSGPVMADVGRPCMKITAAARAAATPGLPQECCKYLDGGCGLSPAQLDRLTTDKPSWPNHSIKGLHQIGMMTKLTMLLEGQWGRIADAWKCLVLMPGALVKRRAANSSSSRHESFYTVLTSSVYGCILRRCKIRRVRAGGQSTKIITYAEGKQSIEFAGQKF